VLYPLSYEGEWSRIPAASLEARGRGAEGAWEDGRVQPPVTHRINARALELLEEHPEGLRWSELLRMIEESDLAFHPKTVNGCVWRLVETFPQEVCKPAKGLFRLTKYQSGDA
jgi:hypothetical protein